MQFVDIEIAPGGNHGVVLNLDAARVIGFDLREIGNYLVVGDQSENCARVPTNRELYDDLIARQQYLLDTLHPAGFL